MSVTVRPRPDGPRSLCPFCREQAGEDVAPCACGVIYHPECRAELSRCATIGCAGKSAGGQRGAHRDVACARCGGLINNDGDMCFGCWSAYHRRCLATGCCAVRPTALQPAEGATDDEARPSPLGVAGFLVFACIGIMAFAAAEPERRPPHAPSDPLLTLGAGVSILVAFAFILLTLRRRP